LKRVTGMRTSVNYTLKEIIEILGTEGQNSRKLRGIQRQTFARIGIRQHADWSI
jgi:hypothetical protein